MRFTTSTALVAVLLLGACHKGSSVSMKNASPDQVAAAASGQSINKLQPGEWEVTAEIVSNDVTGAPAGMPTLGKLPPSTTKICITPEQAAKPDAMLGKGLDQFKKSCVYDKVEMASGKMSSDMHCDMNGTKVKASTSGTFSGTDFSTDSKSEVTMQGGMTAKSETKITARRMGECQAGDVQAGAPATAGAVKAGA